MDLLAIKKYCVDISLKSVGFYRDIEVDQVFYTGFLESKYQQIHQIHGPALSWFQIEPFTYNDAKNWLTSGLHDAMCNRILKFCNLTELPPEEYLLIDQRYAAIICRIIYYRRPEPLPSARDAAQIADMHKKAYNTAEGKANPIVNANLIQDLMNKGI